MIVGFFPWAYSAEEETINKKMIDPIKRFIAIDSKLLNSSVLDERMLRLFYFIQK